MSHIFISYSRKDLSRAQQIAAALTAKGLEIWLDKKSIPNGEDWEQEIYRGIEGADALLFLISPDSIRSEMCNKEIRYAMKNRKRILPVLIRDTNTQDFLDPLCRAEIGRLNWIFCRPYVDGFDAAIFKSLETIQTDYGWVRFHTDLQTKALAWDRANRDTSRLLRGRELKEAGKRIAQSHPKIEPPLTDIQIQYILACRRKNLQQKSVPAAIFSLVLFVYLLWDRTWVAFMNVPSGPARVSQVSAQLSGTELLPTETASALQKVLAENHIAAVPNASASNAMLKMQFSASKAQGINVRLQLPEQSAYHLDFLPEVRQFELEEVRLDEVVPLLDGALAYSVGKYADAIEFLAGKQSLSAQTLLAQAYLYEDQFAESRHTYETALQKANTLGLDTSQLQMGAALAWWRPVVSQTLSDPSIRRSSSQECLNAHNHYGRALASSTALRDYSYILSIASYYCSNAHWEQSLPHAIQPDEANSLYILSRTLPILRTTDRYSAQIAKDLSIAGGDILQARLELSLYSLLHNGESRLCDQFHSSTNWYRAGVVTTLEKSNAKYLMRRWCLP